MSEEKCLICTKLKSGPNQHVNVTSENEKRDSPSHKYSKDRQTELLKLELTALEEEFSQFSARLKQKNQKTREHKPNVFNNLTPYSNTDTFKYLIYSPSNPRHSYSSRLTAIRLCDPWIAHHMDMTVMPKMDPRVWPKLTNYLKLSRSNRLHTSGSTLLPKFPIVKIDQKELNSRQLTQNDVPMLRHELRQKYAINAEAKVESDYIRTKDDFYRMELHKLDEIHPSNRNNMEKSYFAYLQNTPGSKKALYECIKSTRQSLEKSIEHLPTLEAKENDRFKQSPLNVNNEFVNTSA